MVLAMRSGMVWARQLVVQLAFLAALQLAGAGRHDVLGTAVCCAASPAVGLGRRAKRLEPYMLALVGQPSLHGYYACVVYWNKGTLEKLQADTW